MPNFDETMFTNWIATNIGLYVPCEPLAITPHSTAQATEQLYRKEACADLIQRFNNCEILSLEIKVSDIPNTYVLKSFENTQRNINSAAFQAGVPVYYCYNIMADGIDAFRSKEFLQKCLTSDPSEICDDSGSIQEANNHVSLDLLIDRLKSSSSRGQNQTAKILFESIIKSAKYRIGIRTLLIAYNVDSSQFSFFGEDDLELISEITLEFISPEYIKMDKSKRSAIKDRFANFSTKQYVSLCKKFVESYNSKLSEILDAKNQNISKNDSRGFDNI